MQLIAIGRLLQFVLLFATLKISTTLLPPEEMAKVYLIASAVALYSMFLINPVGMFMNRRFHAWNDAGKVQHYLAYFWWYLIVVGALAMATMELFGRVGWIHTHIGLGMAALLVGGTVLVSTVNQVVIPGLNLLNYRRWFVALTVASALASLAAAVALVLFGGPKAENWIDGVILGQFIFAAVGCKVFFSRLNPRRDLLRPRRGQLLVLTAFALPISISVGMGWIQTQSYRFFMEAGLGLHTLGIFTSGYGISVGIISAFESTFTAYLMPIFYRSISYGGANEQSSAWRAYADAIFPSLVLLGFFILATAPELTRVILGPAYQSSYRYVGWGVLAEVGRVAGAVYAMVAHAGMKTKLLLAPSLVGAILALILIWFLMPRYGANGVGIALMVASLVACGLTYAVTRSIFSTKLPRAALMKSALIGASLLLLAVILRWICGQNVNLFATVTQLLTVSVAFALCQYMLLRPLLNRN